MSRGSVRSVPQRTHARPSGKVVVAWGGEGRNLRQERKEDLVAVRREDGDVDASTPGWRVCARSGCIRKS